MVEIVTFDSSDQERLRRLKYVTENFHSLQGLMSVALGVELLAISISDLLKQSWLSPLTTAVSFAAALAYFRYIPRYYERRFGQVEQQMRMTRGDAFGCVFIVVIFILYVCSLLVRPLGRILGDIWTSFNYHLQAMFADPSHCINFKPILLWLVGFVLSVAFRHGRPIDLRQTFLWLGGTLYWGAVILFRLHHPDLVNLTLWKVLDAGWLGISLIIIGIYNHLTLLWLLPRTSEVEQ